MARITRRTFIKNTVALGAGAVLTIYADGGYRLALADNENPDFRMRIIHTNDHHARIDPVLNGTQLLHGGVSRRKTMIDQIRQKNALPLLLLDAGDVFQGTLYFNRYNGMADLEFYNVMGYNAMTVGNHEFDRGQATFADFVKAAKFPVLSANIVAEPTSPLYGLLKPSTTFTLGADKKKVGVFGVTPEDTAILSNAGTGVTFTSAVDAARTQVKALQGQGVNKIIALTHIGIDADRVLARQVAGIGLIIGGHSHTPMGPMTTNGSPAYPELIAAPDGKPVVLIHDWEWGRWLGDVIVSFRADGTVIDVQGQPAEVKPTITPDQGFENRISVFSAPLTDLRKARIGETLVELDGNRTNARTKETNLGDLLADAMLLKAQADGAQIAITNGGGLRATIPAGPVTIGQVLEVLPFGNTLARADLTGAQVVAALENGVSQIEAVAGRFPQVGGVRFSFDPKLAVGSRITGVLVKDSTGTYGAIDPAATYRVVTNDFMLTGGDGYVAFVQGKNQLNLGFILADVLQETITALSPVNVTVDGRITQGSAPK